MNISRKSFLKRNFFDINAHVNVIINLVVKTLINLIINQKLKPGKSRFINEFFRNTLIPRFLTQGQNPKKKLKKHILTLC